MKLIDSVFGHMPSYPLNNQYPPSGAYSTTLRALYHELRRANVPSADAEVTKQLIVADYGNVSSSNGLKSQQREVLSKHDGHELWDTFEYVQNYANEHGWRYATVTVWSDSVYVIYTFQNAGY